ncbi:rho GTPase-activating protein SYDE1 isoform X2 [Gouania willdenowi]|uniref:rho GTPase-activating protein SYDE1 isoform X2 n=1 Tax=Gouania willdenowi TaxID=441366 RepID=UPI0010564824|nr:rho GTPase-activating protein SYDE1 isoform X2 [Gouania willdenowi]
MAEPLLRRTFSRLTGRDRRHRKTENKVNELFLSDVHQSSSPSSSSSLTCQSSMATDPAPSGPHNTITVARKQQWAGQSSLTPSTASSQHAPEQKILEGSAPGPTQQGSSSSSGRRSYLQSLERSSRAWVLSGREGEGPVQGSIWYNPIPEDEDWPRPHHLTAPPPQPDSSPTITKKVGVSSSVMDRLRSPGTKRKLSLKMKTFPELRRKLSLRSASRARRQDDESSICDQTVISRYHLDSSTSSACPQRRLSRKSSAGRGGYLSDGDSPELLPRLPSPPPSDCQEAVCDVSMFRLYVGMASLRCTQRVTGLLTVHLLGLEDMKTSRSELSKDVFVIVQIDGVTRARTALLHLLGSALSLNHTFHLQLERSQQLRIVVLTPVGGSAEKNSASSRNRVCGLGSISIAALFKGGRSQQLCLKLEPRGLLYIKLSLQERWESQRSANSPSSVFGVELHRLVEMEGSACLIPQLIQKSVQEIERRGLKVVGLYRLCGSAAVKKELRDWFERSGSAVILSEDLFPDINVVTGILKDFLRELPSPLITSRFYSVVREAMNVPLGSEHQRLQKSQELLSCLPPPEKATLSLLLDHLSLVASFSSFNRMTQQNLAVVFGPVLLTSTQGVWNKGGGKGHNEEMASAVDFKRHIEALHFLLQLWPVPTHRISSEGDSSPILSTNPQLMVPGSAQRTEDDVVVSRRERLDSPPPINRYAGDWSVCGRELLSDDDEVDSKISEDEEKGAWPAAGRGAVLDMDAPFNCRLSLKDFDMLIHDLDRELANQIHICL